MFVSKGEFLEDYKDHIATSIYDLLYVDNKLCRDALEYAYVDIQRVDNGEITYRDIVHL